MGCSCLRLFAVPIFTLLLLSISQRSQAHHCRHVDFGSCSNPAIKYGWDIDGSQRYGYLPTNDNDFPHGWSPDIATIESFICNRLESPCNAPPETVQRCREAFNLYSGLSGDNAISAWNSALGITERHDDEDDQHDEDDHDDDDDDDDKHCSSADYDQSYITTTTTTYFVDQTIAPSNALDVTTTTETFTTETTSTHTKTKAYTTKTDEAPSPSSTLTITLTLPSSTTSDQRAVSTTSTSTETQTTVLTSTTETTTSVASETTGSDSSDSNSNDDSGPGGGSPFDSESAAPTLAVLGNEGPLKLVFLLSLLALLIALWYR